MRKDSILEKLKVRVLIWEMPLKNYIILSCQLICRDVAGSLAVNYDIETINKEEEQRILISGKVFIDR